MTAVYTVHFIMSSLTRCLYLFATLRRCYCISKIPVCSLQAAWQIWQPRNGTAELIFGLLVQLWDDITQDLIPIKRILECVSWLTLQKHSHFPAIRLSNRDHFKLKRYMSAAFSRACLVHCCCVSQLCVKSGERDGDFLNKGGKRVKQLLKKCSKSAHCYVLSPSTLWGRPTHHKILGPNPTCKVGIGRLLPGDNSPNPLLLVRSIVLLLSSWDFFSGLWG